MLIWSSFFFSLGSRNTICALVIGVHTCALPTSCDVVVVGGCPSGSSAATSLSRAGRDVLLVDKATFPRDKCCGDGLTALALRLMERLRLDPTTLPSWTTVDSAIVSGPEGYGVR